MWHPAQLDNRFNVRRLIEELAGIKGAQQAVAGLSDRDAVRCLQEWEGSTPCFGRETALVPGPNGTCLVSDCCWKNFCSPYRQTAVPLDTVVDYVRRPELDAYVEFLLSRRDLANAPAGGLSVTVGGSAPLESLSRKLMIGSPRSTLCESTTEDALRPIQLSFQANAISAHDAGLGSQQPLYTRHFRLTRSILWTADPRRIFNWVKTTKSLIDASVLDFLPHITTQSEDISVWKLNMPEFAALPAPEFRQLNTPHLASIDQEILVSDPNFVPLLNIDIPFIESASLADIQRLIEDFPDELALFRNYLFTNIDKIRDKRIGSETFAADVEAINRAIGSDLRKLRSDVRRHKLKHYVELTGGALAAFSLSLYCITHPDINTLSVVGPGGFAYVLSGRVSDYLVSRTNLSGNPVYLLWLIGQSKQL